MAKLNCWEFKKCGREPGGGKVAEFGICPTALEDRTDGVNDGKHAGRACWVIAGTFCGGKIQGTSASKLDTCMNCDFYKLVLDEEKLVFQNTKEIQDRMTKQIFSVGLPLLLKTQKYKDVWTHLTGWQTNECLITHLPFKGGYPIDVHNNDKCTVSFIKEDSAFLFETEIIHVQYVPFPLLFFKYPPVIKKTPFRRNRRFSVNIPAKLYFDEGAVVDVLIADISASGCLLRMLSEDAAGYETVKSCRLSFSILNTSLENIGLAIKNTHKHENIEMLGAEFSNLNSEHQKIIKSFLEILGEGAG
ncbi:MAG: flagellar brake protein [Nitrospirae bacterium]|nr:flagellar brake protein [Nitrospirota bacterium]